MPQAVCPICRKPADAKLRPFCSKRCADVDLGRWFNGSYSIAVVEEDGGGMDSPRAERGTERDER